MNNKYKTQLILFDFDGTLTKCDTLPLFLRFAGGNRFRYLLPKTAQHDIKLAQDILQSNFTGLVPFLSLAADQFEERGSGYIIGISSVAGDRGRASNYVYGRAKAGFTAFLSGLRSRLARKNVHIMTVKPGFVTTRMTENMALPPALTASPDNVTTKIWKGFNKKRNIIYVKPVWRLIMLTIRHIPEYLFKFIKM